MGKILISYIDFFIIWVYNFYIIIFNYNDGKSKYRCDFKRASGGERLV